MPSTCPQGGAGAGIGTRPLLWAQPSPSAPAPRLPVWAWPAASQVFLLVLAFIQSRGTPLSSKNTAGTKTERNKIFVFVELVFPCEPLEHGLVQRKRSVKCPAVIGSSRLAYRPRHAGEGWRGTLRGGGGKRLPSHLERKAGPGNEDVSDPGGP